MKIENRGQYEMKCPECGGLATEDRFRVTCFDCCYYRLKSVEENKK